MLENVADVGEHLAVDLERLASGEIDALDWLRMVTMHLRAHRKLLEESAAA